MKIDYFLDYGKECGGAANTLLRQCAVMREHGHCVKIYVSDYLGNEIWPEYAQQLDKAGVCVERAGYFLSSEPEDIDVVNIVENYEDIRNVIKNDHPDIVHSVQLNPVVELACRELDIPHIMSIYVLSDDFFKIRYLDVFPHYLVCDSYFCAKQWEKYLGVKYSCIRNIAPCVVDSAETHLEVNNIRCICVGAIYEGKNQLEVIKGFHKALQDGFRGTLELYGYAGGPYAETCRNYIVENSIENSIKICGFSSNMQRIYENVDVLICGSRRESYPNAVSEAMASGLVVVSTPVGGVPEILKDGVNGFLTDGYESTHICRKLRDCQEKINDGSIDVIRRKSIDTAVKEHLSDSIRVKIEKFYMDVCEDNKTRSESNLPLIEEVRKKFDYIIGVYKRNQKSFTEEQTVAQKLWYLEYIKGFIEKAVKEGRDFYIWGAGRYGKVVLEILEIFFPLIHLQGVIDSFAEGEFMGYEVMRPESILESQTSVILISLGNGQWDVVKKMNQSGKVIGQDYFVIAPRTW